jgi:hypothetical protein
MSYRLTYLSSLDHHRAHRDHREGSKAVPALNSDRNYLVVNSQGRDGLATLCLQPYFFEDILEILKIEKY